MNGQVTGTISKVFFIEAKSQYSIRLYCSKVILSISSIPQWSNHVAKRFLKVLYAVFLADMLFLVSLWIHPWELKDFGKCEWLITSVVFG